MLYHTEIWSNKQKTLGFNLNKLKRALGNEYHLWAPVLAVAVAKAWKFEFKVYSL